MMFRTITLGLIAAFAGASAVQAGHDHHHGHGHGRYGGYGQRYNSGYRYSQRPRVQIYGNWNRGPIYHDTSHYDYHPPTVVPHRNHYHVIPGHYDYHQTGHYHW